MFDREVKPQPVEETVATGEVHFEYREHVFREAGAQSAPAASFRAEEQDAFWRNRASEFANLRRFGTGVADPYPALRAMATGTRLGREAYGACMGNRHPRDKG